jgi:WXG100 protein secretion system (Wss), protein YukD
MKRLIVRIRVENQVKAERYELPAEQALDELIPHLVQGLDLDAKSADGHATYWLEAETGILDDKKSLAQLGVKNESLLELRSGTSVPKTKSKEPKAFEGKFVDTVKK